MDNLEQTKTAAFPEDPTAASRKKDHIELAFQSQIDTESLDNRFYYEPIFAAHPSDNSLQPLEFLGKTLRAPLWVSSMTGGTQLARTINHNLARACREFGMGMGLGSCRSLLNSDETLPDFNVRAIMGDDLPLYANLGIAQLEQIAQKNDWNTVRDLLDKLSADGLIIHVNPLQEWLQPEGDRFEKPPLQTIERTLEHIQAPIIVKEVGQGFGPQSLRALLRLPLAAVDFAANGGTNFSQVELLRSDAPKREVFAALARVGHSAAEMLEFVQTIADEPFSGIQCRQLILSGGVRDFLDGYYLIQKSPFPSVYGQASGFLRHARGSYDDMHRYVENQIKGLSLAFALLQVR